VTTDNQLSFPKAAFAERAAKYIASYHGAEGISELTERAGGHWAKLNSAWNGRRSIEGLEILGATLVRAAKACDRADLVGRDIPLRGSLGGNLQGFSEDINVCAKLTRVIVEILSIDNSSEVLDAIVSVVTSNPAPALYDDAFFARIVLVDLHVERGDYDSAIAAAKTNLTFGCCPTSQFLLFKSLLAQKKSDAIISEAEICLDDLSDRFCLEPFAARHSFSSPMFPNISRRCLPSSLTATHETSVSLLVMCHTVPRAERHICIGRRHFGFGSKNFRSVSAA
jgi:hypothetical protein